MYCLANSRVQEASALIKYKFFNPIKVDFYTEFTPLHQCAHIKDEDLLNLIVKSFNHFVKSPDWLDNQPIHYAAYYWNQKYIEILLKAKADINAVSKIGNTPLHASCLSFDPSKDHTHKFEEFLLDNGANINAQTEEGRTPFMVLFGSHKSDKKFDPVTLSMLFIKWKADLKI